MFFIYLLTGQKSSTESSVRHWGSSGVSEVEHRQYSWHKLHCSGLARSNRFLIHFSNFEIRPQTERSWRRETETPFDSSIR